MTPAGQRVLDVASRLFYRGGINAVGVALIAETAGVTKKTLYDCFGSKQKLVVDSSIDMRPGGHLSSTASPMLAGLERSRFRRAGLLRTPLSDLARAIFPVSPEALARWQQTRHPAVRRR
jgi:AcrR family transcriptional regulator